MVFKPLPPLSPYAILLMPVLCLCGFTQCCTGEAYHPPVVLKVTLYDWTLQGFYIIIIPLWQYLPPIVYQASNVDCTYVHLPLATCWNAASQHNASTCISAPLTALIIQQNSSYPHSMKWCNNGKSNRSRMTNRKSKRTRLPHYTGSSQSRCNEQWTVLVRMEHQAGCQRSP